MNIYRNDPDGEANQRATRESDHYVGGLKLQAQLELKQPVITDLLGTTRVRKAAFSPGNGYRYTALAVLLDGVGDMGAMGQVDPCWLVVVGNNGSAYLFGEGLPFISVRYVAEKFRLGREDAEAVAACVALLLNRETDSRYWEAP